MEILLVAGHGAGDSGAVGNGYKESDLTREIVTKIKSKLDKYASVKIFDMSKNMYQYLKDGGSFDFSSCEYVLEVHFNAGISVSATANGKTTGTEILLHENETGTSVEEEILKNIAILGFKNRGIKRKNNLQNMNILYKKGISYALLEVCFIDDNDDIKLYIEKKDMIASAVADGIKKGFGLIKTQTELTTINDIVWELANRSIITNKALWLKKLEEDTNAYWLARKSINYIINNT